MTTEPNTQTAPRRRPPPKFHRATVAEAIALTPRMRRITLIGDDLASYPNEGPATHCKLALPAPDQAEIPLPVPGPDGLQWPDGRPTMRTYTPRLVDNAGRRLVLDFSLHQDGGPATTWAASAEPGEAVVVSGGRGAYRVDPEAGFTVLAADETALPAVATILEDAPEGARVLLFAEVPDAAEQLSFDTAADLSTTWLPRGASPKVGSASSDAATGDAATGDAATGNPATGNPPTGAPAKADAAPATGAGELAAAAVRGASLPGGPGRFWVGLEAGSMRAVRQHLIRERGVPKDAVYTRAYWKYGAANHPDGDRGEDVD